MSLRVRRRGDDPNDPNGDRTGAPGYTYPFERGTSWMQQTFPGYNFQKRGMWDQFPYQCWCCDDEGYCWVGATCNRINHFTYNLAVHCAPLNRSKTPNVSIAPIAFSLISLSVVHDVPGLWASRGDRVRPLRVRGDRDSRSLWTC